MLEDKADLLDETHESDAVLKADDIDLDLAEALQMLEPCGKDNEVPVFLIHNAEVRGWRFLKDDDKMARFSLITADGKGIDAVIFRNAAEAYEAVTEGKVDINVKSGFAVENLEIRTFGSGNIDISGITASAAIKILSRGSGNISLTGSAKLFSCYARDAGNVFADQLESADAVAKVGGSGSIFLKTNGNMNVIVAGSGSVIYTGKPSMISKYITGSGSVKQRM